MLFFKKIILTQFKNYLQQTFEFSNRVVAICGPNGSGKTNLLDAIYFLCFTKSYFTGIENLNPHIGLQGLRIEGQVVKNNEESNLVCILRENGRKEFYCNKTGYKKFSEHIGKFPCVMIAPDDIKLISGNSDERRKFLDTVLSQLHTEYLQALNVYNKLLQQRNSLIKATAMHHNLDDLLLDTLDEQLAEKGHIIFQFRKIFLKEFLPLVIRQYSVIAENNDEIDLQYYSQMNTTSLQQLLLENRSRDLFLQRTECGIHKDDVECTMHKKMFKSFASQGQKKSLLFALKIAEYLILQKEKKFAPVMLLDDVFEKLDEQRIYNLLHKVCIEQSGQVFITDTHKERLMNALRKLNVDFNLIALNN